MLDTKESFSNVLKAPAFIHTLQYVLVGTKTAKAARTKRWKFALISTKTGSLDTKVMCMLRKQTLSSRALPRLDNSSFQIW